ncbi:MAG: thioredoxin family protein [Ignavibacteria bacterium CG08_land_8_20_14_0_20_37_9]|nr:thioredoxin family protein [Ignavibacteria bacterium]OIO14973.1 MAG: hypothetical protein AUJ54_13500 [Ignavibacteria bacterium CG1_02_37_35]PIS43963.1 MAG: thioredoxin family protein [Ignavibacteria bacterium CG08_land_8_20_14_0_20_37_9]PIX93594.1 MAG: thioredoxin family protein [Ignavibacteria bacterium CG_4_10_14_3_um_filter_37_18]
MKSSTPAWNKIEQSFSYQEFFNKVQAEALQPLPGAISSDDNKLHEYKKLNLQRMKRIEKTFHVSEELEQTLLSIKYPQLWTIITEGWCGDSAQNLPAIAKIAKVNLVIKLQIIERDNNLEIMDLYLTNGTRSIPMLISSDTDGNEIFRWGPRPKEAQQLVNRLKSEGIEHDKFIEQLHLWYAKNKGIALEMEFINLLSTSVKN